MQKISIIVVLISLGLISGCVSNHRYLTSEAARIAITREHSRLREDTITLKQYNRFLLEKNTQLIAVIQQLVLDTARLGAQNRTYWGLVTNQVNSKLIGDTIKKVIPKEIPVVLIPQNQYKADLLKKTLTSQLGAFAAENVVLKQIGTKLLVSIPNYLLFEPDNSEVKGKGLAILIKLAEAVKSENLNFDITTIMNPKMSAGATQKTSDLSIKRAEAVAVFLSRYEVPTYRMKTFSKLISETELPENAYFTTDILMSYE